MRYGLLVPGHNCDSGVARIVETDGEFYSFPGGYRIRLFPSPEEAKAHEVGRAEEWSDSLRRAIEDVDFVKGLVLGRLPRTRG